MPPETEVRLRVMGPADLEAALLLEGLSLPQASARAAWEAELAPASKARYLLLEGADGAPLALGGYRVLVDELHVMLVAVHPAWRRRGLGGRIMAALLDEARDRGCSLATLELRASNAAALALYRSFGFLEQGRRSGYYPDNGEDALILSRDL